MGKVFLQNALIPIANKPRSTKLDKNMFSWANNPPAVQTHLIKHEHRMLELRLGRKHKEVVLKCLAGEFRIEDDTEDLKLQQAFRHQVVDVIEIAASYV